MKLFRTTANLTRASKCRPGIWTHRPGRTQRWYGGIRRAILAAQEHIRTGLLNLSGRLTESPGTGRRLNWHPPRNTGVLRRLRAELLTRAEYGLLEDPLKDAFAADGGIPAWSIRLGSDLWAFPIRVIF